MSDAINLIDILKGDDREFLYDVSLDCSADKEEFYTDEEIHVRCSVKNNGNVMLSDLILCYGDSCNKFSIGIGEQKDEEFSIKDDKTGKIIKLNNDKILQSEYVDINVLERPNPSIIGIDKDEIGYDDGKIMLAVESKSTCKDAVIRVNSLKIEIDSINLKTDFELPFEGKNVLSEKIKAKIECYDLRGNKYEDEKEFEIKVSGVPSYAKVLQFFIKLLHL